MLDSVSLLNFICENEFQLRPNWEYDENKTMMAYSPKQVSKPTQISLTGSNANNKFTAILDFNGFLICTGEADNKKAARERCARFAICIVAFNIYSTRFSPEEPQINPKILQQHIIKDQLAHKQKQEDLKKAGKKCAEEDINPSTLEYDKITLSNPKLPKMTNMFTPYAPYSLLKQTYCESLHKGQYTLDEFQKQNKDSKGPEDSLCLYMYLKKQGKTQYEYTCYGPSLKKGHHKLAIGILKQMYGEGKKWAELQQEMADAINSYRAQRGAGEKPRLQKYDPNYIAGGQQINSAVIFDQ